MLDLKHRKYVASFGCFETLFLIMFYACTSCVNAMLLILKILEVVGWIYL